MLSPKRAKYRKQHRGMLRGVAHKGTEIAFGEYGLMAEEKGLVSSRQLEAARRAITHYTQRGGRIWIRVFPHKPITKKPPESRMGGGKGDVFEFVAAAKPGTILFEMGGVTRDIAVTALRLASHKIGVATKFIEKKALQV
mgnify:CR=1 FL=1